MMRKKLLTLLVVIAFNFIVKAQTLPLDTAIISQDTIFCTGGNANKSALAFNPDEEMYYSNNAGGTYPNEYFDIDGSYIGNSTLTDWRGMWYNSDNKAIEGNAWNGNVVIDSLSASGAFTTSTILFSANMPNVQSAGAFDYDDNVIYYYADSLYSISRVDGAILPTIGLTGLSNISNVVNYSIIYTGILQNELGLYSNTDKELYLFDKATGEYSATIAMPLQSPEISVNWNYAFTNNIFWLYVGGTNDWIGYKIFSDCPTNQASINPEICDGETYTSPLGISYTSSQNFNEVLTTSEGCDSVLTINLKVNVCSGINDLAFENINVFPNPTNGIINLSVSEILIPKTIGTVKLINITGKTIKEFNTESTQLDISEFISGIYFLEIANTEKKSIIKIIKR